MTTPTRSSPTATRRSTTAPTATRRSTRGAPSGNTNDLRGKLLRITVRAGGGYTVPARQPVRRQGTPETRPEIYADGPAQPVPVRRRPRDRRGLRRPTTRRTRNAAGPERAGRPGTGRWMVIRQAGELRLAVLRHRRAARTATTTSRPRPSGPAFNCAAPVNDSAAQHRALRQLPPVAAAGGHRTPTAPSARVPRARAPAASGRWPARRTTTRPATQVARRSGRSTTTASRCSTSGRVTTSRTSRLNAAQRRHRDQRRRCRSLVFDNPMDMEFGPDGALYVLEYGDRLLRRDCRRPQLSRDRLHARGNRTPVAEGGDDRRHQPGSRR